MLAFLSCLKGNSLVGCCSEQVRFPPRTHIPKQTCCLILQAPLSLCPLQDPPGLCTLPPLCALQPRAPASLPSIIQTFWSTSPVLYLGLSGCCTWVSCSPSSFLLPHPLRVLTTADPPRCPALVIFSFYLQGTFSSLSPFLLSSPSLLLPSFLSFFLSFFSLSFFI